MSRKWIKIIKNRLDESLNQVTQISFILCLFFLIIYAFIRCVFYIDSKFFLEWIPALILSILAGIILYIITFEKPKKRKSANYLSPINTGDDFTFHVRKLLRTLDGLNQNFLNAVNQSIHTMEYKYVETDYFSVCMSVTPTYEEGLELWGVVDINREKLKETVDKIIPQIYSLAEKVLQFKNDFPNAAVACIDIADMYERIKFICDTKPGFSMEGLDEDIRFEQYLTLVQRILIYSYHPQ